MENWGLEGSDHLLEMLNDGNLKRSLRLKTILER